MKRLALTAYYDDDEVKMTRLRLDPWFAEEDALVRADVLKDVLGELTELYNQAVLGICSKGVERRIVTVDGKLYHVDEHGTVRETWLTKSGARAFSPPLPADVSQRIAACVGPNGERYDDVFKAGMAALEEAARRSSLGPCPKEE